MPGPAVPRARVEAVDVLRGLVMIVMALDHVRDYLATPGVNPTNLATTTTALFFTRWITHLCAPVFCLLTGVGARLSLGRKTRGELARYLWTRGLWLVVLDAVVLRCLALQWNVDYHATILNVLWMLGWCMVALAGLIYLPVRAVGVIGAVLVLGHNLLDGIRPAALGALAPVWTILHQPGVLFARPGTIVVVAYPLIPWIGVMALGWCLGAIYAWPRERRTAWLVRAGVLVTAAFVALRAANVYGDPLPWSSEVSPVLSFLNTTKYPPSLQFLLMTLGPALLLLRALDRPTPRWLAPARIIGQVPLFYFTVHFVLIHLVAAAVCAIRFGSIAGMFESPSLAQYPVTFPPGWGFDLPGVYLSWLAVVLVMYPLCRWFAGVKQRRTDWWLGYL